MTFLSATEGNTESRGSGGMCDWREGKEINIMGMTGSRQEKRISRKGTNQVLLSRGWH
jgi:hypothetical protein